jgi:uncharacterized iron-regulated protein
MAPIRPLVLLLLAVPMFAGGALAGPSVLNLKLGDPVRRDLKADLVLDGITDTRRGDLITPMELARRLETAQVVYVGEEHTDMAYHIVERRMIEALHDAGREVLIGAEMFPTGAQPVLDRWNQGAISPADFTDKESGWYENWGYRWEYYRDIFVYARDHGIPLFGINLPREVIRAVRAKSFDSLTPEQAKLLQFPVDTTNAEHRTLFRAYFNADDPLHGSGASAAEMLEGLYRAQCAWDAAMGWNAAAALEKRKGKNPVVVILIGGGHVAYGLGSPRQLAAHSTRRIATIMPVPVQDSDGAKVPAVQASYADFLWGIPAQTDPAYPSLGISLAGKEGAAQKVIEVEKNSPAERAGLHVGDAIESLDGRTVTSLGTFRRWMANYEWGDTVNVAAKRDDKSMALTVALRRQQKAAAK